MSPDLGSRPRPGTMRPVRSHSTDESPPVVCPTLICPTRQTLDRLADRWTVVLIGQLENGPRRFGQLRDAILGISEKMLTQTLRSLERDGFVTRRQGSKAPPYVTYQLTQLGYSVLEPLAAMRLWAQQHIGDVEQARQDFDNFATHATLEAR